MSSSPVDPPRLPPGDPSPAIDAAWMHRDDLIAYARRLLGAQGEVAEDVVQEAFLRLHERVASGQGVREARPWLFRVTRNLALDERRRSRRGEAARTSLEVVAPRPPGPHEVLQGREDARRALEGLDALPPRERRTVILDQAGLAPPAIARRMQTTTNAVHQSLFRARRRMRDARAAAWALLPLPLMRLVVRASGAPALDRIPALAPGSGGRLAGGAGLVGMVAAAVIGGGVVADQPLMPHPAHTRHAEPARIPAVSRSIPAPAGLSSGAAGATEAAVPGSSVRSSRARGVAVRATGDQVGGTRRAPDHERERRAHGPGHHRGRPRGRGPPGGPARPRGARARGLDRSPVPDA